MRVSLAVLGSLVVFITASPVAGAALAEDPIAEAVLYLPLAQRPSAPTHDWSQLPPLWDCTELIANGDFQDETDNGWFVAPGSRPECQPYIRTSGGADSPSPRPRELHAPICSHHRSSIVNAPLIPSFRPDSGSSGDLVMARLYFEWKPMGGRSDIRPADTLTMNLVECINVTDCHSPDARRSELDQVFFQYDEFGGVYRSNPDVTRAVLDIADAELAHFEIAIDNRTGHPSSVYIDNISLQVCTRP